MSDIFLFYKLATTSGRNMFYLHLLNGLINSKKYWKLAKKLMLFKKGVIQAKF